MGPRSFLSDPQAREVTAIFQFLDRDHDGHISPDAALKLCERLGFNVDREDLKRQPAHSLLCLADVLGWCESYAAACHESEELQLGQLFSLLQGGGSSQQVITRSALQNYLTSEAHPCDPDVLGALFDEFGEDGVLTCEQFKQFFRQQGALPPAGVTPAAHGHAARLRQQSSSSVRFQPSWAPSG
jgi:Ca2+-binding EF-hand superfamily protein